MWARPVVVVEAVVENCPQVPFAEDDYLVQTLPADCPDQSFSVRILARRVRCGHSFLDADRRDASGKLGTVDAVAVAQQVVWCRRKRKRIDDLLPGPTRRRRLSDRKVQHSPTLVGQHYKDKQHAEGDGGHGEEIAGDQLACLITKKRSPRLRWRPALSRRTILAHRCGGNLKTQFCQFRPNPRAGPSRIGLPHSTDQRDRLTVDSRSIGVRPVRRRDFQREKSRSAA